MNSKEYYSKFIAPHQDMTELIELHQDTEFALFVQDMNSISQIIWEITMLSSCVFFIHTCSNGDQFC
jgi:hypothetical protein